GAADVVLVLGTPLDFRLGYGRPPTFAEDAAVAMVDCDGAELGRNRPLAVGIAGHVGRVLEQLTTALPPDVAARFADWRRHLDGPFGLNGMDVETAVRFRLPMTCIIGNDAGWGQIRNPQLSFFGADRAVATSLPSTRYDEMVEALGGRGVLVREPKEIGPALERALASDEVWCINVVLDPAAYRRGGQVSMAI